MRRALFAVLPALVGAGALVAGPAAAQYNGPFLSWPGKVQPAEAPQPQPQPPAPQPIAEAPPPLAPQPPPLPPRPEPQAQLAPPPPEQPAAAPLAQITAPAPLPPAHERPAEPPRPMVAVNAPPPPAYARQTPRPPQVYPGPRLATERVVRTRPHLRLEETESVLLAKAAPPPKVVPVQQAKAVPPAQTAQTLQAEQTVQPAHGAHATRRSLAKATRTQPPAPAAQTAQHPTVLQTAAVDPGGPVQHSHLPPHIYSVARQYGLQPDPDPLPAQFFNNPPDADMAAPPPPLDPHPVPGSQTVNSTATANTPANRARAIALDTQPPDGGN